MGDALAIVLCRCRFESFIEHEGDLFKHIENPSNIREDQDHAIFSRRQILAKVLGMEEEDM